MSNYAEDIARMRVEAQQRQQAELVKGQEYDQAAAEALANNDRDTAAYYVEQLQEREAEFASVAERLPPMPPPDDPLKREFMAMLKPWMDKDPQRATQLLGLAHQRVTQPGVRFPAAWAFARTRALTGGMSGITCRCTQKTSACLTTPAWNCRIGRTLLT
jgi:hypothetical protein